MMRDFWARVQNERDKALLPVQGLGLLKGVISFHHDCNGTASCAVWAGGEARSRAFQLLPEGGLERASEGAGICDTALQELHYEVGQAQRLPEPE